MMTLYPRRPHVWPDVGQSQVFIREGCRHLRGPTRLPPSRKKSLGSRHLTSASRRIGQIRLNPHGGLVPCTLVAWVTLSHARVSSSVSRKNRSSCACSKKAVGRPIPSFYSGGLSASRGLAMFNMPTTLPKKNWDRVI